MSEEVVVLDGKPWPIRATPLSQLAPLLAELDKGQFTADGAKALGEAVFHGLRRAKCDVTQEFVHENIDMLNFAEVFDVFAKVNGFTRKESGQGEADAGTAT